MHVIDRGAKIGETARGDMSADRAEEVLQQILSQEYWWEDGEDYTSWTVVSGGPADTLRAALASLPVVSPGVACVLLT